MDTLNFDYSAWIYQDSGLDEALNTREDILPPPHKQVTPRYITGKRGQGCDVTRIQKSCATRNWNIRKKNQEYFVEKVLPLIRGDLNPAARLHLAKVLEMPAIAQEAGWQYWETPDGRAAWIHAYLEPDKITKARELGATHKMQP